MRLLKPLPRLAILTAATLLAPGLARANCAPPPDDPPMCLVGTITSPDDATALVERADGQGVETLRPNGQVLDWRVLKIMPRAVLLGRDERQVTLTLDDRDSPPADLGKVSAAEEPSESIAAHSMRERLLRKQARQKS